MKGIAHDEEDHRMGYVDIAEFIKRVNNLNETVDSLDGTDGIDGEEGGGGSVQESIEETGGTSLTIHPVLLFSIILFFFIITIVYCYNFAKCYKYLLKCGKTYNKQFNQLLVRDEQSYSLNKSLSVRSYESSISSTLSTGSGPGNGLYKRRTIAGHIEFIEKIGSGSFGRVWVCNYRGQAYACRVYSTLEQNLWQHETEIQKDLKNLQVVGMIAKDVQTDPISGSTRFLLITDYYSNGNLHQFLHNRPPIDEVTMLDLLCSISRGLNYLHSVFLGNPDKPAVVHFNLKSSNIMVANCGSQCLISDFSNAGLYNKEFRISESLTIFNCNPESLRYRAPELLATSDQVPEDLQLARACDVYSFSLIIWEIASRCILPVTKSIANNNRTNNSTNNYQLPYEEELNNQTPNHELMNQLVNISQVRPKINNQWSTSSTLSKIGHILTDSWASTPRSRLTVLRIMKDLENLKESLEAKSDFPKIKITT